MGAGRRRKILLLSPHSSPDTEVGPALFPPDPRVVLTTLIHGKVPDDDDDDDDSRFCKHKGISSAGAIPSVLFSSSRTQLFSLSLSRNSL